MEICTTNHDEIKLSLEWKYVLNHDEIKLSLDWKYVLNNGEINTLIRVSKETSFSFLIRLSIQNSVSYYFLKRGGALFV